MVTIRYGAVGWLGDILETAPANEWVLSSYSETVRTYTTTSPNYQIKIIGDFFKNSEVLSSQENIFSIEYKNDAGNSMKYTGLDVTFSDLSKATSLEVFFYKNDASIYASKRSESVFGFHGNDIINCFGGDDDVSGSFGNDTIYGGSGNDYIEGDAGNDKIKAGDGNDTIIGGEGRDVLYGGLGEDFFKFRDAQHSSKSNRDIIFDFAHAIDAIDLRYMLPKKEFTFIGTSDFSGDPGEVRYTQYRNHDGDFMTRVYVSTNVYPYQNLEIDLKGKINLTEIDFIF